MSDMIRNLAGECGVEYDAEATRVIDHFCFADTVLDTLHYGPLTAHHAINYIVQETAQQVQTQHGSNTLVYSSSTVALPVIVGHTDQSVLFRSTKHVTVYFRLTNKFVVCICVWTLPVIIIDHYLGSGIGMAVDDENILTIKTLTGSDTAYSANPREAVGAYPQSVGKDTVLVASVQMRNNARATFTGQKIPSCTFDNIGDSNTNPQDRL